LDGSEIGLRARYYDAADLSGELVLDETDWRLCKLGFGAAAQTSGLAFSVEWDGWFTPRYSGEHFIEITHSSQDVELEIDETLLIGPETPRERILLYMIIPLNKRFGRVHLEAGRAYPIRIRYNQPSEEAIRSFNRFSVNMREPEPDRDAALCAARRASAALIFVGPGTTAESEGHDRQDMALSAGQNQLVEDVAAANARTIVIVNSGSPVEMPWAHKVAAIVQIWLPGQEGGGALADILVGNISPGGKLPMTLPVRYEDNPSFVHYPGGLDADYGEGLFVGYRYYDKKKIEPLFPFGHGLSYGHFTLSALSAPSRLQSGEQCIVKVKVTNSGEVRASETVQIYVEDRATQEAMPVRQLRGFRKVFLDPGESSTLEISLPARAFSWFSPNSQAWEITPGNYVLHAGVSSRDLRLSTELEIIS
jgi:beta-glucosidase